MTCSTLILSCGKDYLRIFARTRCGSCPENMQCAISHFSGILAFWQGPREANGIFLGGNRHGAADLPNTLATELGRAGREGGPTKTLEVSNAQHLCWLCWLMVLYLDQVILSGLLGLVTCYHRYHLQNPCQPSGGQKVLSTVQFLIDRGRVNLWSPDRVAILLVVDSPRHESCKSDMARWQDVYVQSSNYLVTTPIQ